MRRRVRSLERRLRQSRRVEADLRQNEARLRSLFEYAEDLVVSCRLDGTITNVNRATEKTVGWSREELIGQSIAKIVTPASFALGQERLRRALAGEKIPKIFELEAVRRDGSVLPTEGWAHFIRDAQGRPVEHLGVFREITERRRAEEALRESEERYRSLFDNANDSILTFALDGTVTTVNRAYERLTGWTRDELIGQTWLALIAPADRERMEDRTRRALADEKLPSIFEVGTLCKDGRVVQLEGRTRIRRDRQERPIGFQGIYRDITERKRAEEALRESQERYRAMFAEAEERRGVLDRLYRVMASMQVSWDSQDRLRAFVQGVHQAIGFDRFYVALASPDGSTFDVVAAVGVEMFERLPLTPAAGALYRAFATRQPLAVLTDDDLRQLPPVGAEYRDRAYFRSRRFIVAPLVAGDRVIGVASADNKTTRRPITPANVELFTLVCQQLATALEEARLYAEARAREQEVAARNRELTEALEQQTATSEILRVISRSPTELQPVLDAVAESSIRLCEALDAAVLLRDRDVVVPTAHSGPIPVPLGERQPLTRRWVTGRAVLDAAPVHVTDLTQPTDEFPEGRALAIRYGHRATLAVPLLREGKAVGAILVRRREASPFSDKQLALLQTFADQAVIAIENARLFKELEARNRDLTETLEQQTATGEILRVISSSPTDLGPVFDTILASAARLCQADLASLWSYEHGAFRRVMRHGAVRDTRPDRGSLRPGPLTGLGRVERDLRPVHVDDLAAEEAYRQRDPLRVISVDVEGIRTGLWVPMLKEGHLVGTIVLSRREVRPFTDAQIILVQTFANQAVIAIENVRLFKELEARTRELTRSVEQLTALGAVSRAVSSTLELETVLQTIVSRANELAGADGCSIYEYDEASEEFHVRAAHNFAPAFVETLRALPLRRGEGVMGRAAQAHEPIQIPDITAPSAYQSRLRDALIGAGFRAVISVPLLREDQIIGSLSLARKAAGEFSPDVVDLLRTFATQSALALQNARLFRELADKSRQLEVASRHKSEFLANMSHELRTPLNAIIGFSEVLTERMFGDLNAKQEEYLTDIHTSGQHLLSLINDILDLSKIEAGRMELEVADFHLAEALGNALILVRERAARRRIALHLVVDERVGPVRADERKIRQVVLNLLSNAIKFTPEGGRVELRAAPVDGSVEVSVADTGVGIAPEDQEAVFEEFRQVGVSAAKREGTGLGLALCRKFVELHGGTIRVTSQVGVGSTFAFTIPARRGD